MGREELVVIVNGRSNNNARTWLHPAAATLSHSWSQKKNSVTQLAESACSPVLHVSIRFRSGDCHALSPSLHNGRTQFPTLSPSLHSCHTQFPSLKSPVFRYLIEF